MTIKAHTSPAAVIIYILLIFGVMGTLFALIINIFNANNAFSRRVFTSTRLDLENQSVTGQILALYQNNPKHPKLALLGNARRTVDYLPYTEKQSGHVYRGKSDIVSIDGKEYPNQAFIPSEVTVKNLVGSLGTLNVISRLVSLDTGFIHSSSFTQIIATTGTSPVESVITIPEDLTSGEERFTSKWEILLFAESDVMYEVVPTAPLNAKLLGRTLNVSVTSKNSSVIGTDQTTMTSQNAFALEPSHMLIASPTDFSTASGGTALLSSKSQPGISAAFMDAFDVWSEKNWNMTPSTPLPTPAGGSVTLPVNTQMEFAVNNAAYSFSGDFDIRAVIEKTSPTPPASAGLYVYNTDFASAYKVGITTENNHQKVGNGCPQNAPPNDTATGYVLYQGSAEPSGFGDGSSECAAHATLIPFNASATYTLRLERRAGQVNAFYCEGNEDACDRADSFLVINPQPIALPSGPSDPQAKVGFYTNGAPLTVRSTRLVSTSSSSTLAYDKTLVFERDVTIKQVRIIGYLPPSSTFNVQLVNLSTTSSACSGAGCTTNYGNQTTINPSTPLTTNNFRIQLSFKAITGDLSEIPFIHGIRVYYE